MSKSDDSVRMTLRLPPDLHARLVEQAGLASLNATIVDMLSRGLAGEFGRQDLATSSDVLGVLAEVRQVRDAIGDVSTKIDALQNR